MPRPKAPPGESKQGLIMALVFFVLLSVLLAVATYYGFADQQALQDQKKQAEVKYKSMEGDRNAQKLQKTVYRLAIGVGNQEDDEVVAGSKAQLKEPYDSAVKSLKELQWGDNQGKPTSSYVEQITKLTTDLKAQTAAVAKANADAQKAIDELKGQLKTNSDEKDALRTALVKAQGDAGRATDKKSEAFEAQIKTNQQLVAENAKLKKDAQDAKEEQDRLIAKLNKEVKELNVKNEKATAAIKPVKLLDFEQAKGKILRLTRQGQSAYINLGSADNVKPQLTFSVFSAGSYKSDADPKGALEVVDVLEPHLALARLTDVRSPYRDPILTDDLLYNPSWSPTLKEHIAIAGVIDLTGDGRDSTPEFMRSLAKQNIVVDAWLDLKDVTVKGRGLSLQTNYLIVGQPPEFEGSTPLVEGVPSVDRKREILVKMGEMQSEAAKLGISIVPARRYMALIGYRVPRTAAAPDYSGRSYQSSSGRGEPKEPAKGAEDKKPPKEKAMEAPKEMEAPKVMEK